MTTRRDFQAELTARVLESMETADPSGWQPPWVGSGSGLPFNCVTGHRYSGGNVILLQFFGGGQSEFATFRQWKNLGASVRKGEKGSPVMYPCPVRENKDDPESRILTIFRWGHVFSADQVDGYTPDVIEMPNVAESVSEADAMIAATGARIQHGGNRAAWSPASDTIFMPERKAFKSTASYYSTMFHELTHWSGHPSRLNRDFSTKFASRQYAAEELTAEIGAYFLNGEFRMETDTTADTASYLAHWIDLLKSDKTAIFTAAAKASKAVDFLARKVGA